MVDDPIPDEELAKAKAYLSGGLELRMDDTRHLASWIGGQEALHDRVFTLDEALESVEAVRSADVTRLAAELFRDEALRMAVVAPARHLRGPRTAPPAAAVTQAGEAARTTAEGRPPALRLARVHLRLGSLALARAELEALSGRALLDDDGLLDLAEARWRTGDLAGAGDAAIALVDRGREDVIALVIAAEAIAAAGRPTEARRLANRAIEATGEPLDALFAGMPRSAIWPVEDTGDGGGRGLHPGLGGGRLRVAGGRRRVRERSRRPRRRQFDPGLAPAGRRPAARARVRRVRPRVGRVRTPPSRRSRWSPAMRSGCWAARRRRGRRTTWREGRVGRSIAGRVDLATCPGSPGPPGRPTTTARATPTTTGTDGEGL